MRTYLDHHVVTTDVKEGSHGSVSETRVFATTGSLQLSVPGLLDSATTSGQGDRAHAEMVEKWRKIEAGLES